MVTCMYCDGNMHVRVCAGSRTSRLRLRGRCQAKETFLTGLRLRHWIVQRNCNHISLHSNDACHIIKVDQFISFFLTINKNQHCYLSSCWDITWHTAVAVNVNEAIMRWSQSCSRSRSRKPYFSYNKVEILLSSDMPQTVQPLVSYLCQRNEGFWHWWHVTRHKYTHSLSLPRKNLSNIQQQHALNTLSAPISVCVQM
jgi:hypothetical protein